MSKTAAKIRYVTLKSGQPAVTVQDLALMLEIDLLITGRNHFRRRLSRALNDALKQGRKRSLR